MTTTPTTTTATDNGPSKLLRQQDSLATGSPIEEEIQSAGGGGMWGGENELVSEDGADVDVGAVAGRRVEGQWSGEGARVNGEWKCQLVGAKSRERWAVSLEKPAAEVHEDPGEIAGQTGTEGHQDFSDCFGWVWLIFSINFLLRQPSSWKWIKIDYCKMADVS